MIFFEYSDRIFENENALACTGGLGGQSKNSVGIDLGITTFATLSDGQKIEAPKPLKKRIQKLRSENQTIVLEDLNVSGMVKNRKLSRAISDLGWRSFRTFLEAKSEKYGRNFHVIDRWIPTSQTCSHCGFPGGKKELNVREWICLNCGTSHDRDINAAVNILVAAGLSETINGRGGKQKTTNIGGSIQRSVNPPVFQQLSIFDLLK